MECQCGYKTENKKSFSNHLRFGCPNSFRGSGKYCKQCNNEMPKIKPSEQGLFCDNVCYGNWISENKPKKCTAKFRYRQPDNEVEIEFVNDEIIVKYPEEVKSVTPGQACVFYDNEECLGGGIIKEVRKNNAKLWYL